MPPHSRLPSSVMNDLYKHTDVQAVAGGVNLKRLPVHEWPERCRSIYKSELRDVDDAGAPWLLHADAAAYGTEVRTSSIRGAGLGVFATRFIEKDEGILPYFGQFVYHDLQVPARSRSARLSGASYGAKAVSSALATTARRWQETALQIRTGGELWQGSSSAEAMASFVRTPCDAALRSGTAQVSSPVWVVPAACCAGGKVNDPYPYLVANAEYEQQRESVCTKKDLVRAGCGFLRVTKDIDIGEEVVVSYGRRHPVHARVRGWTSAS